MWHPKGLIFGQQAQLPTLVKVGALFRVYYSTRIDCRSYIRFFEIDEKLNVISKEREALSPGERGAFDDAGVMPSCVVGETMYYTGWHLRQDVPYSHAIGIARVNVDGTLERIGVVLERTLNDRFMLNSPCVEWINKRWEMLYCSGTGWIENYPTYNISLAIKEGDYWRDTGEIKITQKKSDEAISRVTRDPFDGSLYYAWRTKDSTYKLARQYAGTRHEVFVKQSNWDSDMQCYPFVCCIDSTKYMFYNGNNYGETGIGVAEWKSDIV